MLMLVVQEYLRRVKGWDIKLNCGPRARATNGVQCVLLIPTTPSLQSDSLKTNNLG